MWGSPSILARNHKRERVMTNRQMSYGFGKWQLRVKVVTTRRRTRAIRSWRFTRSIRPAMAT